MQNKNAQIHFIILKKDQQGRARLLMMFCRFCDMMMILGSKGHAFHACMKEHDLLTRKTPKSSHFS